VKQEIVEFNTDIFKQFDKKWALLTAGNMESFNTMTISWGGLGTLWGKPVATVYVRTSRYTHDFMDANEFFSVSFYPEQYRNILGVLGSKSGREMDKFLELGLTPEEPEKISVPGIRQLPLTLECKVIYKQDQEPSAIFPEYDARYYAKGTRNEGDYHTAYYGEITAAYILE
jgi:flavin reductase (DIM6/NTAB) family NADH-FMN oxidoreductase RutF